MAEQTAMRKMCGSMAGFSLTKRDTSASSQVRQRPRAVKAVEKRFVYTIIVMEPTEYCLKTRDW